MFRAVKVGLIKMVAFARICSALEDWSRLLRKAKHLITFQDSVTISQTIRLLHIGRLRMFCCPYIHCSWGPEHFQITVT